MFFTYKEGSFIAFVADGEGIEYDHLPFKDFDKNQYDVTDIESDETGKCMYNQNDQEVAHGFTKEMYITSEWLPFSASQPTLY